WYVRALVGINPDPAAPGFKHIVIKPHPLGDLTFAEAEYDSIRGPIFCRWDRRDDKLTLKVEIPANTTATVYLPTSDAKSIREGGQPLGEVVGVNLKETADGAAVIEVSSGNYEFVADFEE